MKARHTAKLINRAGRLCFLAAGAVLLCLAACSKKVNPKPRQFYYNYYPLEVGQFRIYAVDSLRYNGNSDQVYDSIQYQIRELVRSTFTDASGNQIYRIERYRRNAPSEPWRLVKVLLASRNADFGLLTEDNITRAKLQFPVSLSALWDPDAFNADSGSDLSAHYVQVHVPYTLGALSFDSVSHVELERVEDFVTRLYREERYAANIGLIEFRRDSLDIQREPNDTSKKFIDGFIIKQTLIEHGK